MSDPTIPKAPGDAAAEAPTEVPSELSAEEPAELRSYAEALNRSGRLMTEGRSEEALAELNRLPAPSTEQGKAAWAFVELMKRFPRAMLHTLAGEEQEALAEWRAARAEIPPDPMFDELRSMTESWILVQEQGVDNLTEKEYQSLHPSTQMFVNQQRALQTMSPAVKAAVEAVTRGDEAEYANQLASAERAIDRAGAENPIVKPLLEAIFGMAELVTLAMRQQQDFDRFDFDRVCARLVPIEAKSKQVASGEAATKPQIIPAAWIPGMASVVTSLAQVTERLSRLLQTLLSRGAKAEQLEEVSKLKDEIRRQQQILGELKGPAFVDPWRKLLLDVVGKLLGLTERLSVEIRPSRRMLLNVAGLAATISFVTVAALLLLVGRLTGTELNGGMVLVLSAFFGLVGGFGYGALRFRGFLTSLLFRQGQEGSD